MLVSELLYQGSALLYLSSTVGHVKMGGSKVKQALQRLGSEPGAVMAQENWMANTGYYVGIGEPPASISSPSKSQPRYLPTLACVDADLPTYLFYFTWQPPSSGSCPPRLPIH